MLPTCPSTPSNLFNNASFPEGPALSFSLFFSPQCCSHCVMLVLATGLCYSCSSVLMVSTLTPRAYWGPVSPRHGYNWLLWPLSPCIPWCLFLFFVIPLVQIHLSNLCNHISSWLAKCICWLSQWKCSRFIRIDPSHARSASIFMRSVWIRSGESRVWYNQSYDIVPFSISQNNRDFFPFPSEIRAFTTYLCIGV